MCQRWVELFTNLKTFHNYEFMKNFIASDGGPLLHHVHQRFYAKFRDFRKCISIRMLENKCGNFSCSCCLHSYIASAIKPFNFSTRMIYFIENKNCNEQTLQQIMDYVRNEFGSCELVSIKRTIYPFDAFACIGSVMQPKPLTQSRFFIYSILFSSSMWFMLRWMWQKLKGWNLQKGKTHAERLRWKGERA